MKRRTGHILTKRLRGTTLPELIIALTITSFIASGMATVMFAASYGTSSRREIRRLVGRSQAVRNRIDDALRNARAVLANGTSSGNVYLVLWRGDSTGDGTVNVSELQFIELPNASTTLTSYQVTATPATDTSYAASTNFYTAAVAARTAGTLVGTVWSTTASNFTVTLNDATPSDATMATWSITLTDKLLSEQLVGAASLRVQGAPQ